MLELGSLVSMTNIRCEFSFDELKLTTVALEVPAIVSEEAEDLEEVRLGWLLKGKTKGSNRLRTPTVQQLKDRSYDVEPLLDGGLRIRSRVTLDDLRNIDDTDLLRPIELRLVMLHASLNAAEEIVTLAEELAKDEELEFDPLVTLSSYDLTFNESFGECFKARLAPAYDTLAFALSTCKLFRGRKSGSY